jgi:hypothetical protein
MLGHSTISITLDIYAHVLPDMQQDAATTMQRLLSSQSSNCRQICRHRSEIAQLDESGT